MRRLAALRTPLVCERPGVAADDPYGALSYAWGKDRVAEVRRALGDDATPEQVGAECARRYACVAEPPPNVVLPEGARLVGVHVDHDGDPLVSNVALESRVVERPGQEVPDPVLMTGNPAAWGPGVLKSLLSAKHDGEAMSLSGLSLPCGLAGLPALDPPQVLPLGPSVGSYEVSGTMQVDVEVWSRLVDLLSRRKCPRHLLSGNARQRRKARRAWERGLDRQEAAQAAERDRIFAELEREQEAALLRITERSRD